MLGSTNNKDTVARTPVCGAHAHACMACARVVAYVFCAARAFAVQHNIRARKHGISRQKKRNKNWSGTGQELTRNWSTTMS